MKKNVIVLLFFLLLSATHLFAQIEEVVTLDTGTGKLEGTLAIKLKDSSPISVALIIAGSGPTDRDGNNPMMKNNSLKMLADSLANKGIASLRYDKRGVGESKDAGLKEDDLRFETYVDDAVKWIEYLEWDERFDKIIVIGHSEGSLIGMITAQKAEADKFVSIAGVGEPAAKVIEHQLEAQPLVVLQQSKPILEKLEKGEVAENVPAMLNSLFRPSVQPYLISWFKYDPAEEIAKLEIPVLIVQGTTDIQVGVEHAEILGKSAKKSNVKVLEGMNHVLKESEMDRTKNIETYNQPDLPLKKGLVEAISEFVID